MRKKRLTVLLVCSILAIAFWIGTELWQRRIPVEHTDTIMGIAIVENTDFMEQKEKINATENPGIYFENSLLPYSSAENTLYLAQDYRTEEWEGRFSAVKGAYLCTVEDSYWENKSETIREAHTFPLWLVTEEGYYEMSLAVSGMPVIAIDTERFEEPEPIPYEEDPDKLYFGSETKYYGTIQVFNPGVGTTGYEIVETYVRYHLRGGSSKNFSKRSYAISLQNSEGDNMDVSLLGMNSDNSWKLNALFNDVNRIREKTAADLWELFDSADATVNEAGPRMEYVELVLNNEYIGLYSLVEPITAKKLELDGNDALYKIIGEDQPDDADIQVAVDMGWRIMLPIRMRYPDLIQDYDASWRPMRDYLNIFYRDYEYYGGGVEKVHLGNVCDYSMFLMVTGADDNTWHNSYFAAKADGYGNYQMLQLPWDLDKTFGNIIDVTVQNYSRFDPYAEYVYTADALLELAEHEPDVVKEFLSDRWKQYREGFLKTDNILQMLEENRDYLVATGVAARENARWPEYRMEDNIDEILAYQTNRMDWLDKYFQDIIYHQ